ncbi:hypothetical protein BHM03_00004041 [Ensete ventricosum]|nr:hypothetical protein BHM03_00004041 [Ensete ventricosum]
MGALKLKGLMSLIAETSHHESSPSEAAAAAYLVLLESQETTMRAHPGRSLVLTMVTDTAGGAREWRETWLVQGVLYMASGGQVRDHRVLVAVQNKVRQGCVGGCRRAC